MGDDSDRILTGVRTEIPDEGLSLGQHILRYRKIAPKDELFQVILDNGDEITFGDLFDLSIRTCQGLIRNGLEVGDVVTLIGRNSNQLHASFLGVLWACGVPQPIDSGLKFKEAHAILSRIKPKWIISEYQCLEVASECQKSLGDGVKLIVINSPQAAGCGVTRLEDILVDVDASEFSPRSCKSSADTSLILCSSGTTGTPKGVALSHRSLICNLHAWDKMFSNLPCKEPLLLTSTLSWISGVCFLIIYFFWGKFRAITTTHDPAVILKAIQDYKLKKGMIPPSVIKCILDFPDIRKYDLSSLKIVITGGSMLGETTAEAFKKELPNASLFQLYGLTEAGGMVTNRSLATDVLSIGYPAPNLDIKIVDIDTGEAVGPEKSGELCVRSPYIFNTYVGNEEEARRTIDDDGWFHTGDVAFYSKEKLLYVTSRIKEIFKCQNTQISPLELENHISGIPGVLDVGIAGILHGEDSFHIMGIIVKVPNSDLTAEAIIKNVEENFSSAKHLKAGVYFVERIPRSVAGKIVRKELERLAKDLYEEGTANHRRS